MNKQDYTLLFDSMHPNFFKGENIRNLPEEEVFEEMVLSLDEFEPGKYDKKMADNISFGYFTGELSELKEAVSKVDEQWLQYYDEKQKVYCGFIDGNIASFCIVEDMGVYNVNGRKLKIGGPGCVGTVPAYRDKGIGLTMVKDVTRIFKEEGYDYSYIHYTGVASWYAKLGYETVVTWNKNGIM